MPGPTDPLDADSEDAAAPQPTAQRPTGEDAEPGAKRLPSGIRDRSRLEQLAGLGRWRWTVAEDDATWSPGLYRLLGLEPDEGGAETYTSYLDRVHPEDREKVHEVLQDALKAPGVRTVEHRVRGPEEGTRWLQCHVRPERGEDGVELHVTCVDVSQRRETEEQLSSSGGPDERLGAATSRLLRERVGWILQPLAALPETEDPQAHIERACGDARRLLEDVESLLEARPPGTSAEAEQPVEVEALVDRAVNRAYARLGDREPGLSFDVDASVPSRIRVDEHALQTCLETMVRSTMRRGEAVHVDVQLASEQPSEAELVLQIDAETWGRPRPRPRRRAPDTGSPVGGRVASVSAESAILDRTAARLDAEIEGLHAPDTDRLRLTVPVRRPGPGAKGERRANQKLHVFVVGPAEPDRRRTVDVLERLGARVRSAPARLDIEDRVQGTGTDVVLVDLDGVRDGLELVARLREALPAVQQPFVVGLSEQGSRERVSQAERAGVDAVLGRPVTPQALGELLQGLARPRLR